MDVGASLCVYDVVVKRFTFAISSPDEFLSIRRRNECAAAELHVDDLRYHVQQLDTRCARIIIALFTTADPLV